jgi:creatinine amidohydrolase
MANVAARLNSRWSATDARVHFVKAFYDLRPTTYDPGWEATEDFTRRELGVDESQRDRHANDGPVRDRRGRRTVWGEPVRYLRSLP